MNERHKAVTFNNCKTCSYWNDLRYSHPASGGEPDTLGECRRYPPRFPAAAELVAEFPKTYGTDNCGEHQYKFSH